MCYFLSFIYKDGSFYHSKTTSKHNEICKERGIREDSCNKYEFNFRSNWLFEDSIVDATVCKEDAVAYAIKVSKQNGFSDMILAAVEQDGYAIYYLTDDQIKSARIKKV